MLHLPGVFTDSHLLNRLRQNDRAAFEQVITIHYESVYRQLCHLSGDREWASDLTQETFVAAWNSLHNFDGHSGIGTWLHVIAVRIWYRKGQALRSRSGDTSLEDALTSALTTDSRSNPVSHAEQSATRERLNTALNTLPPAYRQAILLFYREELKYREIAEREQVPIGTVKSRLNAALRRLRVLLSAHGEELL